MSKPTIAVAMSGGVDSSTVAAMLRAEGYNVVGLTMQLWNQRRLAGREGMPEDVQGRCCSIEDVYDARRVAEGLGIPYYVVNHQERFEKDVVRPFVDEYLSGRTPIPCSLCNNHLKFDKLLITARQIGADLLATGQHAGMHKFTVGQRKGLGVATGAPLYVIELRGNRHQVVVGTNDELSSRTMVVKKLNWIAIDELHSGMRVRAKIRHRHEPAN